MTHWTDQAACNGADTAIFFPDPGAHKADVDYVLDTFCRRCPVAATCLAQADLEEPTHADINGIRGGLTRSQRRARLTARTTPTIRTIRTGNAECGTYGGYSRHRKQGTPMCDPCRAVQAAYRRELRAKQREQASA